MQDLAKKTETKESPILELSVEEGKKPVVIQLVGRGKTIVGKSKILWRPAHENIIYQAIPYSTSELYQLTKITGRSTYSTAVALWEKGVEEGKAIERFVIETGTSIKFCRDKPWE